MQAITTTPAVKYLGLSKLSDTDYMAEWPHTTAPGMCASREDEAGIDLFDTDDNQIAIYIRYADGLRVPARTVSRKNEQHLTLVLNSWACRGEVRDYCATPTGYGTDNN